MVCNIFPLNITKNKSSYKLQTWSDPRWWFVTPIWNHMLVNLDHVPKLPGCKYYLKQNSLPWCCWLLIEPSNQSYGLNGKVQRLRSAPTAKSWRISSKNGKNSRNSGLVGCKPIGFVMFAKMFVTFLFQAFLRFHLGFFGRLHLHL